MIARTPFLVGTIVLQLQSLCFHSRAAAGDVDLAFNAGSGVNGYVSAAVLQPDGKIIIGGGFSTVKGLIRPGIARLNTDGSGDGTFVHPGPNSGIVDVGTVVLQADGKVLLGYASGIRRLNSDGTIDETFILPQTVDQDGFPVAIECIAVQPDGKIFISGGFTFVNNTNIQGLARLNSDGSLDSSFATGFGLPAFSIINSIVLQPDGKFLIGGRFPGFNVTYRPNLLRLNADGSVDDTFVTGLSENGEVGALALQADGKVLLGGAFNTVDGTNRNGIARLNADGSLDDSFDPPLNVGSSVYSMTLQSNGRVLIGGSFLTVNGIPRNHFARLNPDGSLDASFDAGGNFGAGLAVQPDGKVIVASADGFGTGANYNLLIRLNTDGSRDTGFTAGGGPDGGVRSLAIQPDGKVVIGGFFKFIDGTETPGVARLHTNGTLDSSFILDPAADGNFQIVALQPDGKLVVGGAAALLTNTPGIARLNGDGGLDSSFDPGSGVDGGQVTAIALQQDGKILVAGGFESVNGVPRVDLVRLNDDGSVDMDFNLNKATFGGIESVAVQSDGKILVGGVLEFSGDERDYALVRVNADGTRDSSFDFPRVGTVTSIMLQPDGKVLIGGAFSTPGNEAFPDWIARLNTDGSIDNSFQPNFAFRPGALDPAGVVSAHALVLQPDTKVLVAGDYLVSSDGEGNDAYFQGVYRLNSNGSLDNSFSPGQGPNQRVNAIGLQADGKVIAGGLFPEFNYVMRPYIVRLEGDAFASLPSLNIVRSNAFVVVSWLASVTDFQLQESTNLSSSDSWSSVPQTTTTNGAQISVTIPATPASKFFRLENQ